MAAAAEKDSSVPVVLPDFIGVGPKRTATTWLYEALRGHVAMPSGVKETFFFNRHYAKGLEWYAAHFKGRSPGQIAGEMAPSYFHSAEARQRIAAVLPQCRIICTLRDPVARLFSLYKLMREYGETADTFEDALVREPEMLESSRYTFHLGQWLRLFGQERVLVLLYDDLLANPQPFLDSVCRFIGIPAVRADKVLGRPAEGKQRVRSQLIARIGQGAGDWLRSRRLNTAVETAKRLGLKRLFFSGGNAVAPLNPATAKRLRAQFRGEIDELEQLIGRDLSVWKA